VVSFWFGWRWVEVESVKGGMKVKKTLSDVEHEE
jgi:hypothetical protein